ncbi:putative tRNA N6-adenosine threonylcarbamoyltransferase, mitochondrial [Operophtera brumata]|uniref:N(6)-L-threonylcarbamoyladenine synthase n=1 Tax=Operophtera brumata TaxID=104452 RepID=A0A0L7L9T2_OPEBR|nr:putative tRNA N6-adenosine threonylcarbamoyltransferase, mitochondrial [Operophtera brumata]
MKICSCLRYFKTAKRSNIHPFGIRGLSYTHDTLILGIETSCDDTGVAIVNGAGNLLGESLYSQNIIHLRYGGVNPVIAHELHRENIDKAVQETLRNARINIENIDAVAVTTKPGLLISLQVGVKYARFIANRYHKPIIPIHHMEAHALVARMYSDIPFPFIVLLISGGHCLLSIVNDVDDFLLLGESLDNAPGQILDKAARRMKLRNIPEYSKMAGGRAIEAAAKYVKNPELFKFTSPLLKNRDCNFSFSGFKNSLEKKLFQKESEHNIMGDRVIPEVNDLCAGLQLAIAEHLAVRTERAVLFCEKKNLTSGAHKNIVVSGGVACNDFIFNSIKVIGDKMGYNVIRPPPKVCTDNGIMIAWNGIEKVRKKCELSSTIALSDVDPKAPMGKNIIADVIDANIPVKVTRLKKLYNIY